MEENIAESVMTSYEQKVRSLLSLANVNLQTLVLLADSRPEVMAQCLDPEIQPYWEKRWADMGTSPSLLQCQQDQSLIYRPLLPQPGISPYHRFAGISLYYLGTRPECRQYLLKAAQAPYFNFHALHLLANEHLDLLQSQGGPIHAKKACLYGQLAAKHHWTPGLLLWANAKLNVAQRFQNTNRALATVNYRDAFHYIVMAQCLAKDAEPMTHNAYFGEGLSRSNDWEMDSFDKMIDFLKSFFVQCKFDIDTRNVSNQAIDDAGLMRANGSDEENDAELTNSAMSLV